MLKVGAFDQIVGNENVKTCVEMNENEVAVGFIEELDSSLKEMLLTFMQRQFCSHESLPLSYQFHCRLMKRGS